MDFAQNGIDDLGNCITSPFRILSPRIFFKQAAYGRRGRRRYKKNGAGRGRPASIGRKR
jgi:hypothetical protein